MGQLSNAVRILLTLPDPPPDSDTALIDAISLVIAQSLLPAAGIESLGAAGTQAQSAASDAASRLTGALLEREVITRTHAEVLDDRVSDHIQGRRDMRASSARASGGKLGATVCGVIGAVMAATSKRSASLVEATSPFGDVAYKGSMMEHVKGRPSSYSVAASSAPGAAVKYAALTMVDADDSIGSRATYGVSNGTQTLTYVADDESSNAKITFSEREEGASANAGGGEADSGEEAGGETNVDSGVSLTISGDEISYISSVTDDEGNISIVSLTEFVGTGAWTLTITSVDSTGAGTSTVITGDAEGNVTEATISNVDEVSGLDTSGFEETTIDNSITEDDFGTTVSELSGAVFGEEGDE